MLRVYDSKDDSFTQLTLSFNYFSRVIQKLQTLWNPTFRTRITHSSSVLLQAEILFLCELRIIWKKEIDIICTNKRNNKWLYFYIKFKAHILVNPSFW